MAIRKQVVTDGITSERRSLISEPLEEREVDAYVREHNREWDRHSTFDGRVTHLEQQCRARFDAWCATQVPGRSTALDFGSPEWYAREILWLIQDVRQALARGDSQRAASDAVAIGVRAAEAEAKHVWPIVQLGLKRKRDTQRSGRARGEQITAKAHQQDARMRKLVREYWASDERNGTLVSLLALRLQRDQKTIRRRLKLLRIPTR